MFCCTRWTDIKKPIWKTWNYLQYIACLNLGVNTKFVLGLPYKIQSFFEQQKNHLSIVTSDQKRSDFPYAVGISIISGVSRRRACNKRGFFLLNYWNYIHFRSARVHNMFYVFSDLFLLILYVSFSFSLSETGSSNNNH